MEYAIKRDGKSVWRNQKVGYLYVITIWVHLCLVVRCTVALIGVVVLPKEDWSPLIEGLQSSYRRIGVLYGEGLEVWGSGGFFGGWCETFGIGCLVQLCESFLFSCACDNVFDCALSIFDGALCKILMVHYVKYNKGLMASIKLRFRPSSVKGKEGTLYYQVIHLRKVAVISTGFRIYPSEWDEVYGVIDVGGCSGMAGAERRETLRLYQSKIAWEMRRMEKIVGEKERARCAFSLDTLVDEFRRLPPCVGVFCHMQSLVDGKMRMRCYGTAKTYANAMRSFQRFCDGKDLCFDAMSGELMQEYEAWMLHSGLKRNSAACYLRTLRTMYRRAVEDGIAEDVDIFRKVHVSIGKTRKRAISEKDIRAIQSLDLSDSPSLDFARNIFMFSFYACGMSFVDIAHLKKSDLRNGVLTYSRRKTFQCLTIRWERPMQTIVDFYAEKTFGTPYLFPIVTGDSHADHIRCGQVLQRVNRGLKRIGSMLGLSMPLSTYVARHSWASMARSEDVPLYVISEGLGHDSDITTQVYLSSLNTSALGNANRKIIDKIVNVCSGE